MARVKKSWTEKLADDKGLPRVEKVAGKMVGRFGTRAGDTFVIPAPLEVDALMKNVKRGRVVTINELRAALAKRHRTTIACPITTGIFAWIAAHAAAEKGGSRMTPYWRTLKVGGEINGRYPGGYAGVARKLRAEGHAVERRGKRWFVVGFEKVLGKVG